MQKKIDIFAIEPTYLPATFPYQMELTAFDAYSVKFTMLYPTTSKEEKLLKMIHSNIPGQKRTFWLTSLANKFGYISQEVSTHIPIDTNTFFFAPKSSIPCHKTIM